MMTGKAADLALTGLTKTYGKLVAVDAVTLGVPAGKMIALLGPSGCGKTTILRMVAGLVQPSAGEILVNGQRITTIPVHRRNIGMLFQNYALFPHLSIAQNVGYGLRMRRVPRAEAQRRILNALDMVHLSAFADRMPAALSGGQQQRVALARALVIEPTLLLLDEPLGALDKNLREAMQVEIKQLQQQLGITAILVTHDQEEAMALADRVVIMRDGRLEQEGTPEDIYRRPVSRFVAEFVGASNILTGDVERLDNGKALISLSGGGRIIVSDNARLEGAVLASVRPEAVDVLPFPSDNLIPLGALPATIERVIYRGLLTHCHMRLESGDALLAYMPNHLQDARSLDLSPGTLVLASWNTSNTHLLTNA
jgi:spermidine/putrescine ABC transporter ATP-binding subunit